MTFKEAEEKLKGIAEGYYCITYSKSVHHDGTIVTLCDIYTSKECCFDRGNTWEEVFTARERRINPPTQEAPED
jgi:hypothetical protein